MLDTKFPPWPSFAEDEIDAVARVLRSGRVNAWTGEECRHFEREFADWAGVRHAVALANGTVALDIAFKVLGIGQGDEVVTTPRTFQASGSSIVMAGAQPVFADVDRDTQNITPATVAPHITPRTRAILCVHLAGWPCDMIGLRALADAHGLKLIEDCAQAHGASIAGQSVGAFADVSAWSFCQDKIITTGGEGGMLTTNDDSLWKAAWSYKDHGKSWEAVFERKHPPGFRWLHESWGTNARMNEVQAAIGRIQLAKMEAWHQARHRNAQELLAAFRTCHGLRVAELPPGVEHAWYKFYAFVEPQKLKPGWTRDRIMNSVVDKGVPCYSGSCPEIYLEKSFVDSGLSPTTRLPVAKELGETGLMFLVHPTLEPGHIEQTCAAVRDVLTEAAG
ncbi:MAG TPA: DegT/DnrJ/EryC1/StrS aminotransferase family protein [Hyphomicrobium sp.]|uniref:DegT/DnrJ/EryC1/StrS family aminotransferase n=1 Tax=Hyphomicrobium sp. TaxID=82 RepID=UPI002CCECF23|nr:DegT/DnrJ/EryC1/StrS aminotransferase family protein [Hyphomicrobium sp.]HRN87724.1 DegT/DnrJ/EryC1/StrS aminotransferase family protein [Hyphomicrobium sp.]